MVGLMAGSAASFDGVGAPAWNRLEDDRPLAGRCSKDEPAAGNPTAPACAAARDVLSLARVLSPGGRTVATGHRIYTTRFAAVYPLYVAKAERNGRTRAEVDRIILWLTGYGQADLDLHLAEGTDFETFFARAPRPNPARTAIRGAVCGVRVEAIEEPLMREIRYLDKLIDELAKGRPMDRILGREAPAAG
jgi:hypothetical protein